MAETPDFAADIVTFVKNRFAWIETLFITGLSLAFGYFFRPSDPFFLDANFQWLALAPLLAGLRYGLVHGFCSSLALIIVIAFSWRFRFLGDIPFPQGTGIGLLLVGLLSGEFCDMWVRRSRRFEEINKFGQTRLDEFSRAFHLLKVSHDNLERQLAGSSQSLRESLLDMRKQMQNAKPSSGPLFGLGELILGIFSGYGSLQAGSIYAVHNNKLLVQPEAAKIGGAEHVDNSDPLITTAIDAKQLVSIRSQGSTEGASLSPLLAAIPLVDVHGRIWAIITVDKMPFMAFNEENLKLLSVLGGHMGDILTAGSGKIKGVDVAKQDFVTLLMRCVENARRFKLPTIVVGLTFSSETETDGLAEIILAQRRGLDLTWVLENKKGEEVVFVIMPLNDLAGMDGYKGRLERISKEHYGKTIEEAGLGVHPRNVKGKETADDILNDLAKACDVAKL